MAQCLTIGRTSPTPNFFLRSKGFGPYIEYPNFYGCHPIDRSPNHLFLTARGVGFHESYRTTANKEADVKQVETGAIPSGSMQKE